MMGARRRNFSWEKRDFSWGLDIPRRYWWRVKRFVNSALSVFSSEAVVVVEELFGEVESGSVLTRDGVRGLARARFIGLRSPDDGAVRLVGMVCGCVG